MLFHDYILKAQVIEVYALSMCSLCVLTKLNRAIENSEECGRSHLEADSTLVLEQRLHTVLVDTDWVHAAYG